MNSFLEKNTSRILGVLALLGAAASTAGLVWRPGEAWPGFLLALVFVLGFGLGAGLFLAMHDASGSGWALRFRTVPESMARTLPWLGPLALILPLGAQALYPWARPADLAQEGNALLRQGWFHPVFFAARAAAYALAWALGALALARRKKAGPATAFLVVFGLTCPLAAADWLASLQPGWPSTIFGIYAFAGIFESGLALMILLLLLLKRLGRLPGGLLEEQLHDLNKLLFTFGCFWMYMWFSQYLLIWYADLPEEIAYFTSRQQGGWFALMLATVALNFGVPFFALLTRSAKVSARVSLGVCLAVLAGRWLDLFWIVVPVFRLSWPGLSPWLWAPSLAGVSAFLLLFLKYLKNAPLVPPEELAKAESGAYQWG